MPPDSMDPLEVAAELRRITGELVRRVRSEADTLAPRLAAPLGHLQRGGAMSTSMLAARQNVRHQSMSATLKELEALGYIERRPDPEDRRSTLITLTPAGERRLDDERVRRAGWLADAISHRLTPSELNQLAACLPLLDDLTRSDETAKPTGER